MIARRPRRRSCVARRRGCPRQPWKRRSRGLARARPRAAGAGRAPCSRGRSGFTASLPKFRSRKSPKSLQIICFIRTPKPGVSVNVRSVVQKACSESLPPSGCHSSSTLQRVARVRSRCSPSLAPTITTGTVTSDRPPPPSVPAAGTIRNASLSSPVLTHTTAIAPASCAFRACAQRAA